MGEKIIKSNDFCTHLLILIFYKIFDCTIKLIVFTGNNILKTYCNILYSFSNLCL